MRLNPKALIAYWRWVGLCAVLGAVIWAVSAVRTDVLHRVYSQTQQWGLALTTVKVGGNVVLSPLEITEAIALPKGYPMLAIDSDEVREKLENMGWIKSAIITKHLPNTLVVQITEHTPKAIWQNKGLYQLVSTQGDLMGSDHMNQFLHLLLLVGEGAPQRIDQVFAILDRMPLIKDHIRAASLVSQRRWTLTTQSGIEILFPAENAPEQAAHLNGVHGAEQLLDRDIIRVDLRLSDRMVVKLPS